MYVCMHACLPPMFTMVSCLAYSSALKMEEIFLQNAGWLSMVYMALYPQKTLSKCKRVSERKLTYQCRGCVTMSQVWFTRSNSMAVVHYLHKCVTQRCSRELTKYIQIYGHLSTLPLANLSNSLQGYRSMAKRADILKEHVAILKTGQ